MALHVGTQLSPAFAALAECVKTGRPPEGIAHGPDGFAEFADKPEAAAVFNQSMVDNSRRFAAEAARAYDFAPVREHRRCRRRLWRGAGDAC